MRCQCQDSDGVVCNRGMTEGEERVDGMCQHCADSVWVEMNSPEEYLWYHNKESIT